MPTTDEQGGVMQEDRRLAVLRAIVEDYVATDEPVGSKALVERHRLGVSPATVRNDMAVLEDEGYITQPHTSAGRVPTDKGYRLFVDRLTTVKPMSGAEKRAISTFLDGAVDLDDVVNRSVRMLSPAHPPGRRRPVPHPVALHRAPHRAGRPRAQPPARGGDPQHRPSRAARDRAPRGLHRGRAGRPEDARPTEPPRGRSSPTPSRPCGRWWRARRHDRTRHQRSGRSSRAWWRR